MSRENILLELLSELKKLGIDRQIDYNKFYLYSLITHSTAIEGSTVTEIENQLLFDEGISAKGRSITEQLMNLDLKVAYERSMGLAREKEELSVDMLKELSALIMHNTGTFYQTPLGEFSSAKGDLRLLNVTAGSGGHSYMNYSKVPDKLTELCNDINQQRKKLSAEDIFKCYLLSIDAHYQLVTIHPWVDGNGRMSRLLMNHLQFEFGLIPTKIKKENKGDYIKALIDTRESENIDIFRNFMLDEHIGNLREEIETFKKSIETDIKSREIVVKSREKKIKSREKILLLVEGNPKITIAELAKSIGITDKAIEKNVSILKSEGKLLRIGSDRAGHWVVKR